jgi:hypothetical protein
MPDSTALDPNGINATKIRLLKTLLDVEAQFSQKIGAENSAELREQDFKVKQREQAQAQLEGKQEELANLDDELARMRKRLARMQADASQRETERNAQANPNATPPVPAPQPDQSEKDLRINIAALNTKITEKQKERDKVAAEIDQLKPVATGAVAKPNLGEVQFTSTPTLPERSAFVEDLAKSAATGLKQPKLAASIALDNFIGMQYEIIAKQLTLLRDEAGPDNRVIFLELPSSIYTVPCKGDNYLAQVQWKITKYFQEIEEEENPEVKKNDSNDTAAGAAVEKDTKNYEQSYDSKKDYDALRSGRKKNDATEFDATTYKATGIKGNWLPASADTVRALDIIPRQSALNVNDVQSTVSRKNFLGILQLLVGFGIKVNYQRQNELYEQYLQQEVFAAGFGKGQNTFGWTFGPLPGTNRVAPGVRTTYAVLAIPKNTSLIEVEASGIGYARGEAPRYEDKHQNVFTGSFKVLIPSVKTEQYYVNEVWYTPVKRGEYATVLLKGSYFSPQVGVLVNGVPLAKSLSLGNTATSDAGKDNVAVSGVRGQFELASSRELIMKFSMGDEKYVGTPDITVVTPEKARGINSLPMKRINDGRDIGLKQMSIAQPMFFEDFALTEKLVLVNQRTAAYVMARLKGTGLRPNADVWVNNNKIPYESQPDPMEFATQNPTHAFVSQVDTGEYFLFFRNTAPTLDKWSVRFRQPTIRGYEAKDFEHKFPSDPDPNRVEVQNYSPDAKRNKAKLDVRIFSDTRNVCAQCAELSPTTDGHLLGRITYEGIDNRIHQYRAVFDVDFEAHGNNLVEKSKVSVTVRRGADVKTTDLPLPVRPQPKSISISPPSSPEEGGSVITIQGINLHLVDKVLIGDKEAEIIANSDSDKLVVKLKSGVFVKADEGVQIPIVLVTKDGAKIPAVVTVDAPEPDEREGGDRPRKSRRYVSRKKAG